VEVKLITHTPEPERVIAAAARLCYSKSLPGDLYEDMSDEEVKELISKLLRSCHMSPFEHASFTFAISGVSRVLTHELVRHRIASHSMRSQRYVNESNFNYIIPKTIQENELAKEMFVDSMVDSCYIYEALLEIGIPKEDARYVLPNACASQEFFTANARSLYNFFSLRCCKRALPEMRDLAWKMLELVREVAPNLFSLAGPSCLYGSCKEGTMSCGNPYKIITIAGISKVL
jgi:thymidylate synthase (FAD)